MTDTFYTTLERRSRDVVSLLCVGLDPHQDILPAPTAMAARDHCLRIISETYEYAAAYKPNSAFFEVFGSDGFEVLGEVIASIPDGIPVILDAKRGDIASTARAYAQAAFRTLGADAITINPYLGYETIIPFVEDPRRGVFLLCKTSNPGSADVQDLRVLDKTGDSPAGYWHKVYEEVALLARRWNKNQNIGLVVGATHPQALARVRQLCPDLWILAPGLGAQGGNLPEAIKAGVRSDGLGLLLPVSRGISQAQESRQAAQSLREAINLELDKIKKNSPLSGFYQNVTLAPGLAGLADGLLEMGCIKFGDFTLKSGLQSPIYIDLRRLSGYPELLSNVATAYLPVLRRLTFDRLGALPFAALPIATAISLQSGWPMVYPRKEAKSYGTGVEVEGVFLPGERVAVIDDLVTTGGTKFEAIDKLKMAGLDVVDVVVLIDRQSGAAQELGKAGYKLHAVFTLSQLLDHWQHSGRVPLAQIQAVRDFLNQQNG